MQRLGGAVTHLSENKIQYLIGNDNNFDTVNTFDPFEEQIIDFLDELSKNLFLDKTAKKYPDVVTFAFYIRKTNILNIKKKLMHNEEGAVLRGRGVVFHIAPSNVPVNFAYSLVASLICGNINIVKVSSKDFIQVNIICEAIIKTLDKFLDLKPYINIVRYSNEKNLNDYFSSICDVRVIWGGDKTIDIIRESKLKPRAREITFADRYSLLVVDTNYYNKLDNDAKENIALNFYNDTFLSDQNACTSPRLICFLRKSSNEFYEYADNIAKQKYDFKEIMSSNKFLDITTFAVKYNYLSPKLIKTNNENFIYRIIVNKLKKELIDFEGNCGTFVECVIDDINELLSICNDDKVQTISYVGDKKMFDGLLNLKGVDRIVPIGKTMDFDMIWDGYNLLEMFTRRITVF